MKRTQNTASAIIAKVAAANRNVANYDATSYNAKIATATTASYSQAQASALGANRGGGVLMPR
ncbi:hypothetical protein BKN38_02815 [Helicobacter sp. CLO-3]|uniref:hypothetical protein n=1 Tax=Helicobacter sp. CLO-3 TaxID=211 RepID=UPI0008D97548|nr:hypothetical protein [Helicobacter sp. CLO-3]OHU84531.1 hypothetical protein BKN38_02815 [Helicobacter sp. CLO-3]